MQKSLLLLKAGFESSSRTTPEFAMFARIFKKELAEELRDLGAELKVYSIGHFYVSGFFTRCNQIWYFSISDVRFFDPKVLIRTATSFKDFTGGRNQYASLGYFKIEAQEIFATVQ